MKKVIWLLVALLVFAGCISITRGADNKSLSSLTPGVFYDVRHGEMFGGGSTPLLPLPFYFSLDSGVITPTSYSGNGLVMAGLNWHTGTFLYDKVSFVRSALDFITPNPSWLEMFTAGLWGSRDFEMNVNRYGFYTGLKIPFSLFKKSAAETTVVTSTSTYTTNVCGSKGCAPVKVEDLVDEEGRVYGVRFIGQIPEIFEAAEAARRK